MTEEPTYRRLAKFMHDEYNRLSSIHNWDVNPDCLVSFDDLPVENQRVMYDMAASVLSWVEHQQTSKLYELRCGPIYTNDEGKWRETSFRMITKCRSDDEAKLAGLLWIANKAESLKDVYANATIGYVKVGTFEPASFFNGSFTMIEIKGRAFYEWKRDWYPYEKEVKRIEELITKAKSIVPITVNENQ